MRMYLPRGKKANGWTGCRAARLRSRETLLITPIDREVIRLQNMYKQRRGCTSKCGKLQDDGYLREVDPSDGYRAFQAGRYEGANPAAENKRDRYVLLHENRQGIDDRNGSRTHAVLVCLICFLSCNR